MYPVPTRAAPEVAIRPPLPFRWLCLGSFYSPKGLRACLHRPVRIVWPIWLPNRANRETKQNIFCFGKKLKRHLVAWPTHLSSVITWECGTTVLWSPGPFGQLRIPTSVQKAGRSFSNEGVWLTIQVVWDTLASPSPWKSWKSQQNENNPNKVWCRERRHP